MELGWLEDFIAVSKIRNFSQAAKARFATQPALSRRIKALEYWYGVTLFDRSTYPVRLTVAGSAFLPVAEQVVADLYRSRREERAKAQSSSKSIRFAMPHSIAGTFFPHWWKKQVHVGVKAMIIAADFDECVEMLLSGSCQFLLCYQHRNVLHNLDAHGIQSATIGDDRLVPVSRCDEFGQPIFSLNGGKDTAVPLLAYTKNSFLGRVSQLLYAKLEEHCRTQIRYETALVEALKTGVLLGEGIAWLPEALIRQEKERGMLTVIENDELIVPLSVLLCRPKVPQEGSNHDNDAIWTAPPIESI